MSHCQTCLCRIMRRKMFFILREGSSEKEIHFWSSGWRSFPFRSNYKNIVHDIFPCVIYHLNGAIVIMVERQRGMWWKCDMIKSRERSTILLVQVVLASASPLLTHPFHHDIQRVSFLMLSPRTSSRKFEKPFNTI